MLVGTEGGRCSSGINISAKVGEKKQRIAQRRETEEKGYVARRGYKEYGDGLKLNT